MWQPREDLTGKQFGRWTVIHKDDNKTKYWICECSCEKHTKRSVHGYSLTSDKSQSCGCLQKEMLSKRNKRYNKYDLSGEYGIGFTYNTNQKFYFDLDDYDKIKDYCWSYKKGNGYISGVNPTNYKKQDYLHRIVMECTDSELVIDHINHNTFDNRKSNLRLVTQAQNCRNHIIPSHNSSGETGVYFDNTRNQWIAQIVYNYKRYYVYCKSKEDAIVERKRLEDEFFQEYSYRYSIEIGDGCRED